MSTLANRSAAPILGGDISVFRLRWQASVKPGDPLPAYEDVVLGSLGRLADRLMLVGGQDAYSYQVMQAGQWIRNWIGLELRGQRVADLPADYARSLTEAIRRSLAALQPTHTVAHRVRDCLAVRYEILALPMG